MRRRSEARRLYAVALAGVVFLTIFSFRAVAPKPPPTPPPHLGSGGGNQTEGAAANLTGNELNRTGFSFASLPNASYTEPPFYAQGPLFVRLKSTGDFDPSQALPPVPHNLTTSYQAGERGHYVLQYAGIPRSVWTSDATNDSAAFYGYIADYGFVIALDAANETQLRTESYTRWLGVYHAGYKLDVGVQQVPPGSAVPAAVIAYSGVNMSALASQVTSSGGNVTFVGLDFLLASLPSASIDSVARLENVQWIEVQTSAQLALDVSAGIVHARQQPNGPWVDDGVNVWNFNSASGWFEGITGAGVTVAVADSGLDAGNNDLNGRVNAQIDYGANGFGDARGHGTLVAGILAGDGTNDGASGRRYVGVAPGAHLVVQRIFQSPGTCDIGFVGDASLPAIIADAANLGAQISTNSWGSDPGYGNEARLYDGAVIDSSPTVAGNQALVYVFAAGNLGDRLPGLPEIQEPATGKNVITVGASENNKPGLSHHPPQMPRDTNNPNEIWWQSSRGPTQDQRIKPDVVAPGAYVLAAESAQIPAQCDFREFDSPNTGPNYIYQRGTSLAAPHVSGAVALIVQYYRDRYGFRPSPALAKALLINGADDMGYGYGFRNDFVLGDGITHISGFGYNIQGWGRVNVPKSLFSTSARTLWFDDQQQYAQVQGVSGGGAFTAAGQSRGYSVYVDGAYPLKISLVWSDPVGASGARQVLVNDLDLRVKSPTGVTYLGNQFGRDNANGFSVSGGAADRINNVENVFVQSPAAGRWTITIAANTVNVGSQAFALVVSGHRISVDDFRYLDAPENHGWWEYDHATSGAMQTVWDATRGSQVMQTTTTLGDPTQYGIALTATPNAWDSDLGLNGRFFSVWMRTSGAFFIYVRVWALCFPFIFPQKYYLTYTPDTGLPSKVGEYVFHHIGTRYQDGTWHLITRDLFQDLSPTGCFPLSDSIAIYLRGAFFLDDLDVGDTRDIIAGTNPTRGWGAHWGPKLTNENIELTSYVAYTRLRFGLGTTISVRFTVRNAGSASVNLLYVFVASRPGGSFRDFGWTAPITLQSGEAMTFTMSRSIDFDSDWPFTAGYSRGSCVGCPGQYWILWDATIWVNTQDWDRDGVSNNQEWRWDAGSLAWRRLDAWSPDTDGDGVADNSDFEPSTNVRTRVSLTAVSVQDNADGGCGWPAGADNYWVLSLNGNQVTTVVRWDFICTSDGTKELRVYFTWDVPDSLASVSVVVQGWDQDVFSGEHYDLRPVSGVNDFSTTWTVPGYGDTQTTTSGGDYPRQTLTIRIGDNSDGFVLFFTHREVAPGNVYESIFS